MGARECPRDGRRPEQTRRFEQSLIDGAYQLEDDGEDTEIRERPVPTISQQGDLFSAPALSAEEKQDKAVANYKILVRQEETSHFNVGFDRAVDAVSRLFGPTSRI